MQLSENQQKALDFSRNISVSAGAGSGKTTVLIHRIIHLLKTIQGSPQQNGQSQTGLKLNNIVAITFTEKAATELKNRLTKMLKENIDSLNKQLQETPSNQLLNQQLNRLKDAYKQSNRANISTIHAFCSRLLRQYGILINLDPEFKLISEADNKQLKNDLIKRFLEQKLAVDDALVAKYFLSFGRSKLSDSLYLLISNGQFLTETEQHTERFSPERFKHFWEEVHHQLTENLNKKIQLDSDLIALIQKIPQTESDYLKKFLKSGKQSAAYLKSVSPLISLVQNLETNTFNIDYLERVFDMITTKEGKLNATFNKDFDEPSLSFYAYLHDILMSYMNLKPNNFNENDQFFVENYTEFLSIALEVFHLFQEEKRKGSLLDFNDLEIFTKQLLHTNNYVRSQCKSDYLFFLIDEFQDTNYYQWQIFYPILSDEQQKLFTQRSFIVGDPKQSIYSFRNAEVAVFADVCNLIHSQNKFAAPYNSVYEKSEIQSSETERKGILGLNDNYRSQPSQLYFINDCFKSIFNYNRTEFDVDFQELMPKNPKNSQKNIDLFLFNKEQHTSEFETIVAQILKQHNEGYALKDIAILFRSRKEVITDLEQQLKRCNIPYQSHLGQSYYKSQEILDFYNLVKFVCYPDDDTALYGILFSPFFNFSQEAMLLLRQRKSKSLWENIQSDKTSSGTVNGLKHFIYFGKKLPIDQFLHETLLESNYLANLPKDHKTQALANIEKFIGIASDFLNNPFRDIYDFELFIKQSIDSEKKEVEAEVLASELENKVQLMTIHASKGLEFPIVICPMLNSDILPRHNSAVFFDKLENHEFVYTHLATESEEKPKGFIETLVKKRATDRAIAEEKRVFYVALTRVVDKLILTATLVPDKKNPQGKIKPFSYLNFLNVAFMDTYNFDLYPDVRSSDTRHIEQDLYTVRTHYNVTTPLTALPPTDQKDKKETNEPVQILHDPFEGETYSATKFLIHQKSDHDYFVKYNLGLFSTDYTDLIQRQSSEENISTSGSAIGTLVHKIFENLPFIQETDSYIQTLVANTHLISVEKERLFLLLKQTTTRFLESQKTAFIRNAEHILREQTINIKIGNDYFTGTLDLIIKHNGHWMVIDYKTNHVTPESLESKGKEYHIQMESYALLLSRVFPDQIEFTVKLYFTQIDEFYSKSYQKSDLDLAFTHWQRSIEEIKLRETKIYGIQ